MAVAAQIISSPDDDDYDYSSNNIDGQAPSLLYSTLLNKYNVSKVVSENSQLFNICCAQDFYENKDFTVRQFKINKPISQDILLRLVININHNINAVSEYGEYLGYPYFIENYLENPSLGDQLLSNVKFTVEQIKNLILPAVNSALNTIHALGLVHNAICPFNLTITNDGKGAILAHTDRYSVIGEQIEGSITDESYRGPLLDYAAPEVFDSECVAASDYYALGVTLYELFTGINPLKDRDNKDITIDFADDFPKDLRVLIESLTYKDIKDSEGNSLRWGYTEVENWLRGLSQPIPGVPYEANVNDNAYNNQSVNDEAATQKADNTVAKAEENAEARAESKTKEVGSVEQFEYNFKDQTYNDRVTLAEALLKDFDNGLKELESGRLTDFFNSINEPEYANICLKAQHDIEDNENGDEVFRNAMYAMAEYKLKMFSVNRHCYTAFTDLGIDLQKVSYGVPTTFGLERVSKLNIHVICHLLGYFGNRYGFESSRYKMATFFEAQYSSSKNYPERERIFNLVIGYFLNSSRIVFGGKLFSDFAELKNFIQHLISDKDKKESYMEHLKKLHIILFLKKIVNDPDLDEICNILTGLFGELAEYKYFPTEKAELRELLKDNNLCLGCIDVSKMTDLSGAFYGSTRTNYSGIEYWNTSNVTNMSKMFYNARGFNVDIGNWNTSKVTNMHQMFFGAIRFNQDISKWKVSAVKDMRDIFTGAKNFNQNLDDWDLTGNPFQVEEPENETDNEDKLKVPKARAAAKRQFIDFHDADDNAAYNRAVLAKKNAGPSKFLRWVAIIFVSLCFFHFIRSVFNLP